ncbi:hypothetical protein K491DRAFT_88470 [Lophiostoma macrostomum CBS 122681]|uniref:Zn(2)-C6 fungal-type domain-containing protein n=1 Tax=Lophiostoma macrostomum CBS 122681 TaxID=1314788 RepID=A0A6A6SWU3_9PLEO|nr:hypothetical protein K491DRAFT_88470 [Lophiostoma macrostomum CBS 122681]
MDYTTMNARSDENAAKRRKVRKGTHSCQECRRRKVKCTFDSSEHDICVICRQRGTACVSQELPSGQEMARENVGNMKQDAFGIARVVDRNVVNTEDQTRPLMPAVSPATATCVSMCPTPASTLHGSFSDVVPEPPSSPATRGASRTEPTASSDIIEALVHALPAQRDVEILLARIARTPKFSYQHSPCSVDSALKGIPTDRTPFSSLIYPESHPVLLGRKMLLFASSLQLIPPKEIIAGLTKHHHVIMETIAESAIRMVTTNDLLSGALEMVDNIIIEGLYHIDGGNIRRAWIAMRRAVVVAQLQGLDRQGQYRFKRIKNQIDLDPANMWVCIVSMERVLSLLLGLPTSTSGIHLATQEGTGIPVKEDSLPVLIMDVTAKIIERNRINVSAEALHMTRIIDQELVKISDQLPSSFWRPLMLLGLDSDSEEASREIRRAWDHMCYYMTVSQLHLPYMLYPDHVSQMLYSKMTCVNASREILTRQAAIRMFNAVAAFCRMGDFMALVAGLTLMLAHIVSHCQKDMDNMFLHQRSSDRAIVARALECMTFMSKMHDDVLSAKCATLLEELLVIEADAAQGHRYGVHKLKWAEENQENDYNVLIIKVPYLGGIRIAREDMTSTAPFAKNQTQKLREGVTVGGIGSIHLDGRVSDDRTRIDASDVTETQAASIRATGSPISEHTQYVQQIMGSEPFAGHDQMLPDAAADLDDWVFQGLDTAFFDVLMRGGGDQQPHDSSTETWDLSTFT